MSLVIYTSKLSFFQYNKLYFYAILIRIPVFFDDFNSSVCKIQIFVIFVLQLEVSLNLPVATLKAQTTVGQ